MKKALASLSPSDKLSEQKTLDHYKKVRAEELSYQECDMTVCVSVSCRLLWRLETTLPLAC